MVLDVTERSQREVLRVLREDPSLQVLDRFDDQIAQLGEIRPTPSRALLDEGQRWVYFLAPWGMQFELVSYPGGKAFDRRAAR